MIKLAFILLITALLITAENAGLGQQARPGEEATMALGFVLLASYMIGSLFPHIKLPMITGYMLAGILFGPSLVHLLTPGWVVLSEGALHELHLINHIALGLIAFTAGGELRISSIKARWKGFLAITLVQSLTAFVGVAALVMLLGPRLPGFENLPPELIQVTAILLACTAVAKSPATTIAVINETQARGPMTDVALGVTVIKDMVVIGVFAAALSVARATASPGGGPGPELALQVAWEVLGSLLAGLLLGWLLSQFIERVQEELPLVLLTVAFLSVYLAEHVHLHGLLICMTAGFVVENFSPHGEQFIQAVEKYSLPVYVVFFTLAGAEIELELLSVVGAVALLLVVARAALTFLGTWLGAWIAGEPAVIRNYAWMGFLGQAGVTLGFAVIIAHKFPRVGAFLSTIIVAAVAINQVIGPVAFRWALSLAGEIGRRRCTSTPPEGVPSGGQ